MNTSTEPTTPTCMHGRGCTEPSTHAVPRYFLKRPPGSDRNYYLCKVHAGLWNKRPLQAFPAINITSLK